MNFEKLKKIALHFGVNNQIEKTKEELKELKEALEEFELYKICPSSNLDGVSKKRKHIIEEIADVYIMLEQIKYIFNIEEENVKEIERCKIDRTLKRIEEKYYERAGE